MEGYISYEMRYFDLFGRGEFLRACFVAGGCDWSDDPVDFPTWGGSMKGKLQMAEGSGNEEGKCRFLPIMRENGGAWMD